MKITIKDVSDNSDVWNDAMAINSDNEDWINVKLMAAQNAIDNNEDRLENLIGSMVAFIFSVSDYDYFLEKVTDSWDEYKIMTMNPEYVLMPEHVNIKLLHAHNENIIFDVYVRLEEDTIHTHVLTVYKR
jgi:hypothetical protein